MKKIWLAALTALCLIALSVLPAAAKVQVPDMDITVTLLDDGAAVIRQIWHTDADEGTEFYLPFQTNGYLEIADFTVSDITRDYAFSQTWDTDQSFDDKAYRCGILPTDDGVELCWGISQYGQNRYLLQYTVRQMVGAYTDSDGFLFRFVNSGMNTTPTAVHLAIRLENGMPVTDDNCHIWAFGYDGDIQFEDGGIIAVTDSPILSNHHMTLMVELDKDLLHPARLIDDSFDTVRERAFEGSDYDDDEDILLALLIVGALLGVIILIALTVSVVRRLELRRFTKSCGYWREAPNGGHLNATAHLGAMFSVCEEEAVIGAHLLRLIAAGCIQPAGQDTVGAAGRVQRKTDLLLVQRPQGDNHYGKQLYDLMEQAGGEDRVVSQKEMKRLCREKPELLRQFIDGAMGEGHRYLTERQCLKRPEPKSIRHLTDAGKQELGELIGLKRFLTDFSLLNERTVEATAVWQDYMVYAMLFGIADKVVRQLKVLYPAALSEIEAYDRRIVFAHSYCHAMFSSMRAREMELEAKRSSGSGGHASFGGGGGFSGGGIGGGAR